MLKMSKNARKHNGSKHIVNTTMDNKPMNIDKYNDIVERISRRIHGKGKNPRKPVKGKTHRMTSQCKVILINDSKHGCDI